MSLFKTRKIKKLQDSLFETVLSRFEEEYKKEAEGKEDVGIIPIALHLSPSQINFLRHFLRQTEKEESLRENALHMLISGIVNEYITDIIYELIYSKKSPSEKEMKSLSMFLDRIMKEESK